MILVVTGIGSLIHIYSTAYMHEETRRRVRALLLVSEPVRGVHARARARLEFPRAVRRLGGRRSLLVSAHRLLVPEDSRRRTPARRPSSSTASATSASSSACCSRSSASAPSIFRKSPDRLATLSPETTFGTLSRDHAAAVRRRDRQIGADSAVRLAARRDGRPDACLRPHPRGDDGDGGRLHDRPQRRAVQPRAARRSRSSRSSASRRR